jgi:hypothetical protein
MHRIFTVPAVCIMSICTVVTTQHTGETASLMLRQELSAVSPDGFEEISSIFEDCADEIAPRPR